jgi:PUA domain protein
LLSKRDKKRLLQRLRVFYPKLVLGDDPIEVVVEDDMTVYIVGSVPGFIELESLRLVVPHLKFLIKHRDFREWIPNIIVDMGAVKPISRGADLMRPGIKEVIGDE